MLLDSFDLACQKQQHSRHSLHSHLATSSPTRAALSLPHKSHTTAISLSNIYTSTATMGADSFKIVSGQCTPDQAKHNSADSTTPLAREASRMDLNRVSAGMDSACRNTKNLRRTISRPRTLSSSFDGIHPMHFTSLTRSHA